jgi:hypothetical protein
LAVLMLGQQADIELRAVQVKPPGFLPNP